MNVCMVGYGMMGVWHSEALQQTDAVLHTVVGRRLDAAKAFAQRYGYRKVAGTLEEALADPEIDVVILGTPSDQHEAQAVACLEAGKHTLIEIPIAMSLAGAKRVVAAGRAAARPTGCRTRCASAASARPCSPAAVPARRRSATSPADSSSSG